MIAAIQFLTRIPMGPPRHPRAALPYFPLVGLLVGFIGAGLYDLALRVFPDPVARTLAVAALVALYSAFHLDGLSDFTDGLYGGRDRESTLRIMRDPHAGAMGVVAIVVVLALKFACALSVHAFALALPIATYAGHASMALAVAFLPRDGSAALFEKRRIAVFITSFPALVLLPILLYPIARSLKRLGAITGDVCGAISEIAELGAWLILIGIKC